MKLTLTDRDKKLLLVLAFFLLIVGLGVGVIFPLFEKYQDLHSQVTDAQMEQAEKQQKVTSLENIKKTKESEQQELSKAGDEFASLMPSMRIDKMMTELALGRGVVVNDLNISMPSTGSYTIVASYQDILQSISSTDENSRQEPEGITYGAIYTASVEMTMSGSRQALQSVIDACAAREPEMRITELLWQPSSRDESSQYSLALALDIYMAESTQEYQEDQAAQQDVEEESNTQEAEDSTDTDITE